MNSLSELRPALDDGETARESGSAPALSVILVRRIQRDVLAERRRR